MAEFNYGITIPQPNTSMFGGGGLLQGLATIEQIRGAQAQQALAKQLAPYELQKMKLGIQAQQQSMAQSAAAAGRAATSFAQEQEMRRTAMEQQRTIADSIARYGSDPNADLSSLTSVIPYLSKPQLDAVQSVEQIKLANIASKIDKDNPDPNLIQQVAARSMALPSADANKFFALYSQIPDKVQQSLKNTAIEITNAGLAKKPDIALKRLQEQADALSNSEDPKLKELGAFYQRTIEATPENAPPSYWGMLGTLFTMRTGDKEATAMVSKTLTDYYKEGSPEAIAGKVAETEAKQADANLKKLEFEMKQAGVMDPDKKRSTEIQMAQSFESEPLVRSYVLRRDIAQGILSGLKLQTASGDASAITNLVKIDDPTSTVSVTESGRISGGNLPEQFLGFVEQLRGKGRLSPTTRDDMLRLARERMKTSQSEYDKYYNNTKQIALRYGLNPNNIFALPNESLDSLMTLKKPQTAAEAARGKTVPPPIPTARPAAPAAPVAPTVEDLLKKYSR